MTPSIFTDSSTAWFALRVKPNCEKRVSLSLRGKGYEEFLPLFQSRRNWHDRRKNIEAPVFSGYIFCRFSAARRLPILTTPGVMHIGGIGAAPAPISDAEIESLKTVVESRLTLQHWPFLSAGETVQIEDGPLR